MNREKARRRLCKVIEVTKYAGTCKGVGEVLKLHVAQEDMGRVIGKQGRIAKAIRTIVKSAATRENKKVTVDID